MSCICPLCNNNIDKALGVTLLPEANIVLWPNGYVTLTQAQFVIFEKIHSVYPKRIGLDRLAMYYYVTCRDPDDPPGNDLIRVQISLIRKKLRDAGSPINIPAIRRYGLGYRTEMIGEQGDGKESVA